MYVQSATGAVMLYVQMLGDAGSVTGDQERHRLRH